LDKGGINYRKEVWAILKKFRESKTMTIEEVTDQIMALPTPKEVKNPYVKGRIPNNKRGKLMRW